MDDSPIPSFGKLHHLGSRHAQFVDDPGDKPEYTEKVDGSQFSFMLDHEGELHFRSKRAAINPQDPGMFEAGVLSVRGRKNLLRPGVIYRGEYLRSPKQNALEYSRMPNGRVYLFRMDFWKGGICEFTPTQDLVEEALRLGFEPPNVLDGPPGEELPESCLGGVQMEGYVVKNYRRFCPMTGHFPLQAKYVRTSFREIAGGEWRKSNPTSTDIVSQLAEEVCPDARMEKVVQHLNEQGLLDNSPRDINLLMKELAEDIRVEASEYIAERLLSHYLPHIVRRATRPFPQWYRQRIGYGD
jgi:hypothetical protein